LNTIKLGLDKMYSNCLQQFEEFFFFIAVYWNHSRKDFPKY